MVQSWCNYSMTWIGLMGGWEPQHLTTAHTPDLRGLSFTGLQKPNFLSWQTRQYRSNGTRLAVFLDMLYKPLSGLLIKYLIHHKIFSSFPALISVACKSWYDNSVPLQKTVTFWLCYNQLQSYKTKISPCCKKIALSHSGISQETHTAQRQLSNWFYQGQNRKKAPQRGLCISPPPTTVFHIHLQTIYIYPKASTFRIA